MPPLCAKQWKPYSNRLCPNLYGGSYTVKALNVIGLPAFSAGRAVSLAWEDCMVGLPKVGITAYFHEIGTQFSPKSGSFLNLVIMRHQETTRFSGF